MTYLSRITLNPLRRCTQKLVRNPQAMHAAVLGGFPPSSDKQRVLWRYEQGQHDANVLVLSANQPSWEALVEQAGWPNADKGQPLVKGYEPLLALVAVGREFAFKVCVNPVESRIPDENKTVPGSARGKRRRIAHVTAEQQLRWFLRRAGGVPGEENLRLENWGFEVVHNDAPEALVTHREVLRFRKQGMKSPLTISTATVTGQLRVTDSELFQQSLTNGIGKAKAYGCGLLTLAAPTLSTVS